MLSPRQQFVKRTFDVALAAGALAVTWWLIAAATIAARISTGGSGLFRQRRIGLRGRPFTILKIRTMRVQPTPGTCVTTSADPRITPLGRWLRRTKIDELPQLINVLRGDMSFVGPRPDVPELLPVVRRLAPAVLALRPGITGPASLKYRREEELLAAQADPEAFNLTVVFPDKLRINAHYQRHYSVWTDVRCLWRTLAGGPPAAEWLLNDAAAVESSPAVLRRAA